MRPWIMERGRHHPVLARNFPEILLAAIPGQKEKERKLTQTSSIAPE